LDVDRSGAAASTERDNRGKVEVNDGGQTSTCRFAAVKVNARVKVKVDVKVDDRSDAPDRFVLQFLTERRHAAWRRHHVVPAVPR
jgi:hypothetical protein